MLILPGSLNTGLIINKPGSVVFHDLLFSLEFFIRLLDVL